MEVGKDLISGGERKAAERAMGKESSEILERDILRFSDYAEWFREGSCEACLIVNRGILEHPCMFGFPKLDGSFSEAGRLFERMERRAAELGFSELMGPVNYCTWMSYRFAISGFSIHYFPDCENSPEAVDWLRRLHYRELYSYRSAAVLIDNPLLQRAVESYRSLLTEGYRFLEYRGEEALGLAGEIYEISRDAFSAALLYSELPREAFDRIYLSRFRSLPLVLAAAISPEGEMIGYIYGYPNPLGTEFISKTSAVKKRFQKHGVYAALLCFGSELVRRAGYHEIVYHFQCEQRPGFRRFPEQYESREKRYAVFSKSLRGGGGQEIRRGGL